MKETLSFSTNWNNKLECDYFTTLRLFNTKKFIKGKIFNVTGRPNRFCFDAEVIDVKNTSINTISDWMAYLDTGYSAEETKEILRTMYKKYFPNATNIELNYVLLKKNKMIDGRNIRTRF